LKNEIFTDGSKIETNTGSSYCVFENKIEINSGKHRIGPFCSVFQAQLIATKKSIEFIQTNSENNLVQNRDVVYLVIHKGLYQP
jgi:hypothetical protein